MKLRAFTHAAVYADVASHQLGQLAGDGGAQPGAAIAAGGGGVGLRERGKNVLQLVLCNANARVLNVQVQQALVVSHIQAHMAVLGELDGIAHQVGHDLLNP